MKRSLLVLLLLASVRPRARADEPPPAASAAVPTRQQVAEEVLGAYAARDAATIRTRALLDDPDPWFVVDELLRRGRPEEALAFAKAAPRPATEALPAYVEARRAVPDDGAARDRYAAAQRALESGKAQEALDLVGEIEVARVDTVVGIRLLVTRGLALETLRRWADAHDTFVVAGEGAERLGWLADAKRTYSQAGYDAFRGNDYRRAVAAFERCGAAAEREGDRLSAAQTLGNLGALQVQLGELALATATLERVVALQQALGDRLGVARTLGNLGAVKMRLGDPAASLADLDRALRELEVLGDSAGVILALSGRGAALKALGRYADALACYERARALRLAGKDELGAAAASSNIGNVREALGDFDGALEAYASALEVQERLGDRAGAASTQGNMGVVWRGLGDYARAEEVQRRALATWESLGAQVEWATALYNLGSLQFRRGDARAALVTLEQARAKQVALGARADAAFTLGSIGNAHEALGEYAKALSAHEESYRILEALGQRPAAIAQLGNLGTLYFRIGDLAAALKVTREALAAHEALGDRGGAVDNLCNLGAIYEALEQPAEAVAALERARDESRALGTRASLVVALVTLGNIHLRLKEHARARDCYEQALGVAEELGSGTYSPLVGLALVHEALGSPGEARRLYDRVLSEAQAVGDRGTEATTLGSIALLDLAQREPARAVAGARRAVGLFDLQARGLGDVEGTAARDGAAFVFATGARAAMALGDAGELAWFLESGRAAALLEGLAARRADDAGAIPAEVRAEEGRARAAVARATRGLRRASETRDRAAARESRVALEAAEADLLRVIARIQRDAKASTALDYPKVASLSEIQAALEPGDALVLYGLFDPEACALVVTRQAARIVPLGATADIVARVDALGLSRPDGDAAAALAALAQLVVAPLALPADARRLLVSPAGALTYVPFAALLPGTVVTYVPSATTYIMLREVGAGRHGEGVLALGDPDYGASPDEHAVALHRGAGLRLTPLPATRAEATSVGTRTLLGKEATEAGLAAALARRPRWRAVHFACHGLVDVERPALSALALTAAGDDDGFLTCLEVFRLRIPADLVVLSACETGKGKLTKAEGLVGFTRAFMFAGAPSVLCSLWKVDDEATAALMTKFYELWNPKNGTPGIPTAEALRQAQEFIRGQEKWKHPYYWAAWVLWGPAN